MEISISTIALALALSGAAGLRGFVPLFFLSHALRLDLISAHHVNANILPYINGETGTYSLLGLLTLLEIALQKVPQIARMLDLPFLLLRLLAAVASAFAVIAVPDFGTALTAAIVLGAIGALPIMNLQAQQAEEGQSTPGFIHLTATTLTDGFALGACSLSLQMPYLGLLFLHVAMWLTIAFERRWRKREDHPAHNVAMAMAAPQLPEGWKPGPSPIDPSARRRR